MTALDGSWIRRWRAANGYTQENLAGELNVKRQTVIAWEKACELDRIVYLALTALEDHRVRKIGRRDKPN